MFLKHFDLARKDNLLFFCEPIILVFVALNFSYDLFAADTLFVSSVAYEFDARVSPTDAVGVADQVINVLKKT